MFIYHTVSIDRKSIGVANADDSSKEPHLVARDFSYIAKYLLLQI